MRLILDAVLQLAKMLAAPIITAALIFAVLITASLPSQDERLAASVVKVLSLSGDGGGTGWSTMYQGKRAIVTNDHVCSVQAAGYVGIEDDNGRSYMKKVLKRSYARDLCLVEGIPARTLEIAEEGPRRFANVAVMGHPFLNPTTPSQGQYIGNGIVPIGGPANDNGECEEGAERVDTIFFGTFCIHNMELSFTTVPIYPGNSGSPVVNKAGEVVGVMNSASSQDNRGNFIPLDHLKEFLSE